MSAFGNDSNILKRGTLRPKMWSLKHMWTESGCNKKKEVRKRWKFISGKNNQSEGNVIPEGPRKHLPKKCSRLCTNTREKVRQDDPS